MGKEEKGARAAKKGKSSGKAPLLQPRSSVRGDAAASQKTDVVTDDGGSKECEDFHYDTKEMYQFLETIEGFKDHPQCVDCRREVAAGNPTLLNPKPRFVMCSGCSQCFCAGLASNEDGPIGHARLHAKSACHPVALWVDQPDAAYCFQCAHSLSLKVIASAARSHKHGYAVRGMPNCRAKCYVNALVQCLLALDDMWMSMLGPDAPAGPLGVALKELFLETRSGNDAGAILNTRKLMESICPLDARYSTTDHQDCQELLVHVRNGLIEEERRRRLPDVRKDAPTVVDSIFKGEVSVMWTCNRCLHTAGKDEEFYELSLPLPPSKEHPGKSAPASQMSGRPKTADTIKRCRRIQKEEEKKAAASLPSVKQCIEYYFRKVKVQKRCEICEKPSTSRSKDGGQVGANTNSGGHADETLCLSKLPPVLTIHVLRFKINEKRVGHVKFEENLDVGEYLDPRSADKGDARYRLVGVIEHLGRTVTPGHFVAYVRGSRIVSEQEPTSSSSSWFQANDTRIRNISLDDVLKHEAFLLFYEKIKA